MAVGLLLKLRASFYRIYNLCFRQSSYLEHLFLAYQMKSLQWEQ